MPERGAAELVWIKAGNAWVLPAILVDLGPLDDRSGRMPVRRGVVDRTRLSLAGDPPHQYCSDTRDVL
jgi:hypothetical protein